MKLETSTLLALLLGCGALFGQDGNVAPEPVTMDQLDAPLEIDPKTATEGEVDRSGELKTLMETGISAAKKNNTAALRELAAGLTLPDPTAWFVREFGASTGGSLQQEYPSRSIKERLPRFFRQMVSDGSTEVRVDCIPHSKHKGATAAQRLALAAMTEPIKLYSVHFAKPGERGGFHVASFAFVEGQFRFIGRLGGFAEE